MTSGEIAIAKNRRSDKRGVLNADTVMNLVALFEAAQDRHRSLDRRWFDQHLLKAPLESRILLDVLPVLVERGGAHHSQTAPGEHRLQHVAGVHGAFGAAACTHDRVHFVDEGDDLAVGVLDLFEYRLQSLLELAAVLRAGDHRGEIEADEALVLEARGNVAFDDALGKPLDDGGLADPRLADQHRVVLRATTQHPDHPADLLIAADHRIEFALAGPLGEVEAEPLERLVLILGVLAGDAMTSPHLAKRREQGLVVDPAEALALAVQREQEMLGGEVLVGEVLAHLIGFVEDVAEGPAELGLGAIGVGQFVEDEFGLVARGDDVDLDPVQERKDNPLFLAEQGEQQVFRNDLRVRSGPTEFGGCREGFGCFERPTIGIERHGGTSGCRFGEASKLECL